MKKSLQITILLGVVLFLLTACSSTESESTTEQTTEFEPGEQPLPPEEGETIPEASEEETSSEEATIEMTSSGFSPSTLTVSKGTTVSFTTMDEGEYWPASAVHPSHEAYPTEGGCIGSTFDACKALAQGETFEFTFDEGGEWDYHDHKNPSLTGIIIVE